MKYYFPSQAGPIPVRNSMTRLYIWTVVMGQDSKTIQCYQPEDDGYEIYSIHKGRLCVHTYLCILIHLWGLKCVFTGMGCFVNHVHSNGDGENPDWTGPDWTGLDWTGPKVKFSGEKISDVTAIYILYSAYTVLASQLLSQAHRHDCWTTRNIHFGIATKLKHLLMCFTTQTLQSYVFFCCAGIELAHTTSCLDLLESHYHFKNFWSI